MAALDLSHAKARRKTWKFVGDWIAISVSIHLRHHGVGHCLALSGQAVFLQAAVGFVGEGVFDESIVQ